MARWTWISDNSFVASAKRTTDGASNSRAMRCGESLALEIAVTAITGTNPVLRPAIQWSFDQTNWFTSHEIVGATATGRLLKTLPVQAPYFRLAWTIKGTFASGEGITFEARVGWRE